MIIQQKTGYVLIDLGGTHLRCAVWPNLDMPVEWKSEQFVLSHNFEPDFAQLVTLIKQQLSGRQVLAVGVALPGLLNKEKAFLERAHNLPEWVNQPIAERLNKEFNCPVYLDNDAVAAALGEFYYSDIKSDFLFAIWGTGVGGAILNAGQPPRVAKVDYHQYLAGIEQRCGGKVLTEKFGQPLSELSLEQWQPAVTDFLTGIKQVAVELRLRHVIAGGGVAIKQKQRLALAAPTIFGQTMYFRVSQLGTAENFGLYGAAALIRFHQPV